MEFLNSDMSWYSNGKTDDFTKVNKRTEWTNEYACNFYGGLPWNQKILALWKKSYDQPRQHIKKQRHYFANKGPSSQNYFSSSHVWMWELDHKESRVSKNWCFGTVVLEKTLESPLGCKEIQPVNPKGNQSWIFMGRTDAEAETPVLWHLMNWLLGKDPDAGKDGRWEEKGMTVGWMASPTWRTGVCVGSGVGDGQGRLLCCSHWLQRVRHDWGTELNWAEKIIGLNLCFLGVEKTFPSD